MPKDHDRKTNALRELDAAGVLYEARFFACPEAVSYTHLTLPTICSV